MGEGEDTMTVLERRVWSSRRLEEPLKSHPKLPLCPAQYLFPKLNIDLIKIRLKTKQNKIKQK